MNRNVESHFAQLPSVDIQRSIFDRSSELKTSFNAGDLIPIYIDEVLPGDTFSMTTSKVVRAQTLLTPVMDNMYLDTYFFFVPNRLVWDHWKEFMGENNSSAWIPQVEYQVPSIASPSGGFNTNTIADYMGLPVGVSWTNSDARRPSALPFRAYAKICDEWFRDQNLTDPLNIPTGDSNQTGSNGTDYINDTANGGAPFKVAKYHDYFTSCLPDAQKGNPVTFGANPIVTASKFPVNPGEIRAIGDNPVAMTWNNTNSSHIAGTITAVRSDTNSDFETSISYNDNLGGDVLYPNNLWADPTGLINVSGVSFTINELRLAFQLQKWYEQAARSGTRYIETIKAHFGVTSPDARLQRTEYLGGNRIPLSVNEVTNSAQSSQDFLGDLGAKSSTSDIHQDFQKSFTEHGFVIGVCCVRYDHSYAQGLERFWSRRKFTDYYWPVFANIGEQPVYDSEIYADSTTIANDTVFGFQEAWADYRFKENRCTAEMRPGITNTLAHWHFADYYTQKPTLSDGWIREDKTNIDRTLAVTSSVSNQFFGDFYFKCICTRAMPTYSIPGLIDHH